MAVRIRLRRIGKNPKGRPFFRISAMDEHKGRDARVLEDLGFYNPLKGEPSIKKEKVEAWLKKGAQPSLTVKNLIKKGLKEG